LRLRFPQCGDERALVQQITLLEMDAIHQVHDAIAIVDTAPSNQAKNLVTTVKKKFG
jgi:hypothetical protein